MKIDKQQEQAFINEDGTLLHGRSHQRGPLTLLKFEVLLIFKSLWLKKVLGQ